jgi:ATP-binding cassette, subfamily B, bacterial
MAHNEFEEEDFEASLSGKTLRRMMGLTLPHWPFLFGFIGLVAFVAIQDSVFNFLKKEMIDLGITPANTTALGWIVVIYAVMAVLQSAGVFGFIYLSGILAEQVQYDLRKQMFNHLQELSFSYFDRTPIGWIMSRLTSDTSRIADLITWGLLDVTWAAMAIAGASFFMIYINWRLGLMVFLIIPVLIFVAAQFRSRLVREYRSVRKINSRITGAYNENITGIRVVKALNREETNLDEFGILTSEMYRASYRAAWLSALFLPVVQLISALALSSVAWYGGRQVSTGIMSLGDLQAFISYISFMLWPVQDLARVYAEMQHALASAERTFSLIDAQPEIVDKPEAIEADNLRGDIEFDHVEFYYQKDKPVLRNFSLTVKQGETIALVGATGGGKSTIVNLLCRFYEPKGGTIRIGGRDYTDLSLHTIQSHIGMVLQTPHLFSGTIRENIRYGRLNATDLEIEEAAQVAGAHDFIVTLDKGYDAAVGEGGDLLSVGQKQLISLARAVLAQPDLFIMDEATSSVDTLTEALVQKGMEHLMEGRTSFVIAHRLSTIKRASRIIVIESGGIKEMGTHAELLRQKGHYYDLYTRQFRKSLEQEYKLGDMTGLTVVEA